MSLDVSGVCRIQTRGVVILFKKLCLSVSTRERDTLCVSILICTRIQDHGSNRVATLNRIVQAFEDQTADSLAAAKPIRPLIITETTTIRREEPEWRKRSDLIQQLAQSYPSMLKDIAGLCSRMRFEPPATAIEDSFALRLLHARCKATRLELQAGFVSQSISSLSMSSTFGPPCITCIDGHARTFQIVKVGDTVRKHGLSGAC